MARATPPGSQLPRLSRCAIRPSVKRTGASTATHDREALSSAISQVAAGDRAALREVYDRTSAKLFGLCLRILGDTSEAEETMQEVYLSVWRRAGSFDPARASPITWLAVIARSRAIDRLRAAGRLRPAVPIDAASDVADPAEGALAQLEAKGDATLLNACVEELEPRHAQAIRAAFFDGFTYPELADRAQVPLGTMKSWVRRSLLRLRECLER